MPSLLSEIKQWKLEAKLEDVERYFFHVSEYKSIEAGQKSYVIGRKGTGKTAISEYITKLKKYDVFAQKLSFKNFPFNELYAQKNDKFTMPNQYISLWKYLILMSIGKMMARNQGLDPAITSQLQTIFPPHASDRLDQLISGWIAQDIEIKIAGTGGKVSRAKKDGANHWVGTIDILEEVCKEYLDASIYYIIFDELDEDYKNILSDKGNDTYLSLVTSLFKAVQDIRSIFSNRGLNVFPIVLLRDDIYGLINDSDKNKWEDLKIDMEWNEDKIKDLLAFRLSRAADPHMSSLGFDQAWALAVSPEEVRFGNRQRKGMESFKFISRSTQMRPRDFIRYLQVAAERDDARGLGLIQAETLRVVDQAFSNYLRNELVDEMHGFLPNIQNVLDMISQIRKAEFTIDEFREVYAKYRSDDPRLQIDAEIALKVLFHFSVLGNKGRGASPLMFFRYRNKESRLNFNEKLVVHRGLYKALQII